MMNSRRNFLRLSPLLGAAALAPVAAPVAAVALAGPSVPMRGEDDGLTHGEWKMMDLSTAGTIAPTRFVSHSMRQQPDGKWIMVFDREL
jgi:hypothetical protein